MSEMLCSNIVSVLHVATFDLVLATLFIPCKIDEELATSTIVSSGPRRTILLLSCAERAKVLAVPTLCIDSVIGQVTKPSISGSDFPVILCDSSPALMSNGVIPRLAELFNIVHSFFKRSKLASLEYRIFGHYNSNYLKKLIMLQTFKVYSNSIKTFHTLLPVLHRVYYTYYHR